MLYLRPDFGVSSEMINGYSGWWEKLRLAFTGRMGLGRNDNGQSK